MARTIDVCGRLHMLVLWEPEGASGRRSMPRRPWRRKAVQTSEGLDREAWTVAPRSGTMGTQTLST